MIVLAVAESKVMKANSRDQGLMALNPTWDTIYAREVPLRAIVPCGADPFLGFQIWNVG